MSQVLSVKFTILSLGLAFAPTSAMSFEFKDQSCAALHVFAQENLSIETQGSLVVISYEDREVDLIYPDIIKAIKDVGMINDGERLKKISIQAHVTPANGGRVLQLPVNPGVLDVVLAKPILAVTIEKNDGMVETRSETIAWANAIIDQSTTLTASGHSHTFLPGRIEMYRSGYPFFASFKRNFYCEGLD